MTKKTKKNYIVLLLVFAWSMLILILPGQTWANGGTLIFGNDVGPYNVTVSESPSPPSPDVSTHLSVLLTKAKSDLQVRNANIIFTPAMSAMAMPDVGSRRSFQGQTPNTYDVDLPLNMEGDWVIHTQIAAPGFAPATLDLNLKVEKPSAPWPFIIGILVGLPLLGFLTWFLLFRGGHDDDDDEESKVSPRKPQTGEESTPV